MSVTPPIVINLVFSPKKTIACSVLCFMLSVSKLRGDQSRQSPVMLFRRQGSAILSGIDVGIGINAAVVRAQRRV